MQTFELGRSDNGAPAILLVHGMGHWTQAAWDRFVPFVARTHRIVAFDLPGFGTSAKPDAPYTLAYFTSALRAVVAATGLHDFALAGHSLGGLIAANYAAYHPGRIRALGLIAAAGFLRSPHLALRIAASRLALRLRFTGTPPRAFVEANLRRSVYDGASIDALERDRAHELARDPAVTRAFLRVYAGAAGDWRTLRTLQTRFAGYQGPVTLVWGRDDRYIPSRALAAARRVYPQAKTLLIERCGHCPAIERPQLVAERFLANAF